MSEDWARYWRSPERPLEAMHAHFRGHAYHRHSHDSYSFGVTESGVQAFHCRGGTHASVAGTVLAFNPDDPHDGHSGAEAGFTYRIVHIGPDLVREVLTDAAEGPAGLPLFAEPLVHDPALAAALGRLHGELTRGGSRLALDEALRGTVLSMARRGATRPAAVAAVSDPDAAAVAARAAAVLRERLAEDVGASELAAAAGRSRFAVYRAFRAVWGMAPSDYQRQLRLRRARDLIAAGVGLAEVSARVGFADQSHLTRWFCRYYGITPGAFREAVPGP
ncbi:MULTISPECIES: AraC family transcriptional regulator [unclassified Nocardiopsis]|uniref:AraC family transcriptional regulator n=1 Tax=unclassified Nocardiopsis TaxID=2649073 RepID=UPI001F48E2A2|nr:MULTISPECIES: AraC family transcriptional regulator [unclassified Nocardiopsis]